MESSWQLDSTCRSSDEWELSDLWRWSSVVYLYGCLILPAQTPLSKSPSVQQLKQLADAQRWNDIVLRLEPVPQRSADLDYYFGIALAQLGRLQEARNALQAGCRLAPTDPRFPVELAGIAFKQKKYPHTIHFLRRAIRLTRDDVYANDFLGTTYFLEGNLEAALKYWNRAGKPVIAGVREDPVTRISPALLDHAFAFSPAATLSAQQFLSSQQRVRALGIFPQFHFDLDARSDGKFDVVFRAHELNGFGDSKLEALLLLFQGIPFQEVSPQYYNLHREAINFDSMVRWDTQKRRIFAQFSGPFERSAKFRWELNTDLRNENWAIRDGFTGPAPVLASFNMRHEAATFDLASFAGDRFAFTAGAELSHRDFRGVALPTGSGTVLTPQMLATGYQVKQQAQLTSTLWRTPERRFNITAGAASDAARLWSQSPLAFEKLTGSLAWHWFPQPQGDDYETTQELRAGKTFGQVPFDELFILGLERDNDLPLRAHIGTRNGRKGSAPLGRDYLLENLEIDKNIYGNGIVKLQLGPFFDFGKIVDPRTSLGSHQWLFDTGLQAKVRVFGVGLVFSYGKDLRTGNNAFYLSQLD
jgi:tetratricopeptide (TPR) repeat protein